MATTPITVPTVNRAKGAAADYAVGAGGGILFAISRQMFGTGFLGSLAAAVAAGSIIKGQRGETLATVAGFMALADIGSPPGVTPPAQV